VFAICFTAFSSAVLQQAVRCSESFLLNMRVWIASLIFYSSVFAICEFLRYIVNCVFARQNAYVASLLNEAIGTIQVCAPMFDVNLVLDNYGLQGCFVEIVFLELANAILLRDAMADPCPLIYGLAKGSRRLSEVVPVLSVQFMAAYAAYLGTRLFWSLGVHPAHLTVLHEECTADLTVAVVYGSLVEAVGTFVNKASEIVFEHHPLTARYISIAMALLSGLVTVLGIHLTGMYANPIVAWACTFNCGQVSHLSHFAVYWIAPLVGWHFTDRYLSSPEGEHDKKE
jgi:hypothetical protein